MLNAVAALVFAAFVVLGLRTWTGDAGRRRSRVSLLLAFTAVVSFGAGLAQRDTLPF